MTTPPLDLPALRDIAEAATPGPWEAFDANEGMDRAYSPMWCVANEEFHNPTTGDDEDWMGVEIHVGDKADSDHIAAFDPPTVLALLDRLETAESWTTVYPCKDAPEPPYDFRWCETHDRTFPLDGACDHKGKSENDWIEGRESEQRYRAVMAEGRAEAAEAKVAAVREALEAHPKACDRHTEDDPIKCGWKRAVADVTRALDGGA